MKKIGVLIGSLRKNSYTKGVTEAITKGIEQENEITFIKIDDLPYYNQDFDDTNPEIYSKFRETISKQDGFIIATPEYNRNISAVLKNAIDVASRPWGKNLWDGKPVLPVSQSPSAISGALANHSLRQSLEVLNMKIMEKPEVYIGSVNKLTDNKGNIIDESASGFLQSAGKNFIDFIGK